MQFDHGKLTVHRQQKGNLKGNFIQHQSSCSQLCQMKMNGYTISPRSTLALVQLPGAPRVCIWLKSHVMTGIGTLPQAAVATTPGTGLQLCLLEQHSISVKKVLGFLYWARFKPCKNETPWVFFFISIVIWEILWLCPPIDITCTLGEGHVHSSVLP